MIRGGSRIIISTTGIGRIRIFGERSALGGHAAKTYESRQNRRARVGRAIRNQATWIGRQPRLVGMCRREIQDIARTRFWRALVGWRRLGDWAGERVRGFGVRNRAIAAVTRYFLKIMRDRPSTRLTLLRRHSPKVRLGVDDSPPMTGLLLELSAKRELGDYIS